MSMDATRKDGDRRWYLRSRRDPIHETVHPYAVELVQRDGRRSRLRAYAKIYADEPVGGALESYIRGGRRMRHDVTSNAVNALHARISKAEPVPWVTTEGGSKDLQERGQQLTDWLAYKYEELDAHSVGSDTLHDSLITGTGILFPTVEDGDFELDECWVGDFAPDPREEVARRVRTMYRIRHIDRQVLKERYPGKAHEIDEASDTIDEEDAEEHRSEDADLVVVVEAWHIVKSRNSSRKGRHCIVLSSCTLVNEEYEQPYFPWVEIHFERNPNRYFSIGLVERMSGMQSELNDLTHKISEAYWLCAPSVWVPAEAQVNAEKINNGTWNIYRYSGGAAPIFNTPSGIAPDFVMREETLIRRAYEMRGISQLSAQSSKPAGLNSGKALTVHQDIESERFLPLGKSYEQAYVDLAQRLMDLADSIRKDESNEAALVAIGGEEWLESLDYRTLHIDRAKRRIRITPASALSQSPAGRLQEVAQMVQMDIIEDPEDIRELLNMPDLRHYNRLRSAARRQADRKIQMCLSGKQATPNPYLPLAYTHKAAVLHLNDRMDEVDEDDADEGVDMLMSFIAMTEQLMRKAGMPIPGEAPPAPPAPPAGAPPPPGAAPGMPPMPMPPGGMPMPPMAPPM